VTAILPPDGVSVKEIRRLLREEHDIVVAGGQDKLSDQIFRVGHVGYVSQSDLDEVLVALKVVLERLGHKVEA
jgi:aspartate aminotransferase-like enzyme